MFLFDQLCTKYIQKYSFSRPIEKFCFVYIIFALFFLDEYNTQHVLIVNIDLWKCNIDIHITYFPLAINDKIAENSLKVFSRCSSKSGWMRWHWDIQGMISEYVWCLMQHCSCTIISLYPSVSTPCLKSILIHDNPVRMTQFKIPSQ